MGEVTYTNKDTRWVRDIRNRESVYKNNVHLPNKFNYRDTPLLVTFDDNTVERL